MSLRRRQLPRLRRCVVTTSSHAHVTVLRRATCYYCRLPRRHSHAYDAVIFATLLLH